MWANADEHEGLDWLSAFRRQDLALRNDMDGEKRVYSAWISSIARCHRIRDFCARRDTRTKKAPNAATGVLLEFVPLSFP